MSIFDAQDTGRELPPPAETLAENMSAAGSWTGTESQDWHLVYQEMCPQPEPPMNQVPAVSGGPPEADATVLGEGRPNPLPLVLRRTAQQIEARADLMSDIRGL